MGVFAPTPVSNFLFDYVVSGCVWSGDSYATTLNASMTAGVVCVSGQFVNVSAVTARSFTASKDTYIDVTGAGVLVYTEVTNNAASPALAAGSIRIGIIITGAGSIAAATSVNQGQETMILPIASSIAYSVTDSLGNLICPRDPDHKTLGYRQIIANAGAISTIAQVTGLSVPVIVPTNRKINLTAYTLAANGSIANTVGQFNIWDGVVNSGTKIQDSTQVITNAGFGNAMFVTAPTTPTSASKTYNVGASISSGTITITGAATAPAFLRVELA